MGCCTSYNLNERTLENTPKFTLKGVRKSGKILKVIDGDTVDLVLYGDTHRYRSRLMGIDAPDNDRKNEKQAATEFLRNNIEGKVVTVVCDDWDKYGRLLVTIFNPSNVNEKMVEYGHAVYYDGGTKKNLK